MRTDRLQFLRRLATTGLLGLVLTVPGVAQDPAGGGAPAPAPSPPQAPGGGAVLIEQDTSGLMFEWVLAAIGVGVAVYAVCRSSRRN